MRPIGVAELGVSQKHMKTPSIIFAAILCISTLQAEDAPSLSLDKAAQIAQAALTDLHLPANNFLRSISLQRNPSETPSDYYIATFEPKNERKIIKGGSISAEPTKIKFIKIAFDGKASVIEQNLPGIRFILKKQNHS